jgi:hypothetical protein
MLLCAEKEKKRPTKIECLTEAGLLIKTLYFKDEVFILALMPNIESLR